MALYSYSLEDFVGRIAGDLQKVIRPHLNLIYFGIMVDVHGRLIELTPVDTGYLRMSLTAALNDNDPIQIVTRDPKQNYETKWAESDAAAMDAFTNLKSGDLVTIGYCANYAPYVEDMYHMVKTVQTELPQIVSQAVHAAAKGAM